MIRMSIKSILIIEDEASLRSEVVDMLSFEGYEMLEAENGREGIQKAREHDPDLILCDIMMPEMDGMEVLNQLRKFPETMYTPFIFMTALAERSHYRLGMETGADDYLTKPFTIKELLGAIEARKQKQMLVEEKIRLALKEVRASLSDRLVNLTSALSHREEEINSLEQRNKVFEEKLLFQEAEATAEALRSIEAGNTIRNLVTIVERELKKDELSPAEESILIKLRNEIRNPQILSDNKTIFQMKFNQLYPDYLNHLIGKFPGLSQQDLTICSAVLLNLNTQQISKMLNIDASSVRKSKYRLKKKMNLDEQTNLAGFLHELKGEVSGD